MTRIMAILGISVIIFITFLFSNNKKAISISQIIWAFALQAVLALSILRLDVIGKIAMLFFLLLVFYYNTHKIFEHFIKNIILRHVCAIIMFSTLTALLGFLPRIWTDILFNIFYFILMIYLICKLFNIKKIVSLKIGYIFGAVFCILVSSYAFSADYTGAKAVELFSSTVTGFINFGRTGADFVFGPLMDRQKIGFVFAISMLYTSIYFGAIMSLFDYLGITYSVVSALSKFMTWHMTLFKIKPLSGAEMLVSTANIVLSMNASPLLVIKYLKKVTYSEIATMMVAGLATIAGGTMAIFISMGIPASYMLAASVMSTPAAILLSKLLVPETEIPETMGNIDIAETSSLSQRKQGGVISAITNGISIGTRTGIAISASVLAFLSIIALINFIFASADAFIDGKLLANIFGNTNGAAPYKGIIPASLTDLFRIVGKPFAILLGVAKTDASYVGELLALKITANEAVAYAKLLDIKDIISPRSLMISTYALCGFANLGSLGILLGAMNGVCPERSGDFAKFGIKAVFFGAFASWMTAAFVAIIG